MRAIGEFAKGTLDDASPDPGELHRRLAAFNARRLRPSLPDPAWRRALASQLAEQACELELLEAERAQVLERAATAPRHVQGFIAWFEELKHSGPGQNDPLFPFLAEQATREQLRWFLEQEIAGEAGFDDLVALTQVKMPDQAKLELARNYWDEMGRGAARGMHGPMLENLARDLDLHPTAESVVWESLALANVLTGMATNRGYAFHAVGALGAVELTAPGRAALVNEGLKRVGCAAHTRQYFALHATLDVKHSEAWNREVLAPLVASRPELAQPIAEGALMRLEAGARCFARYRRELGIG